MCPAGRGETFLSSSMQLKTVSCFSLEPVEAKVTKQGKINRSLSFCSLLPLSSKRGKLKISKFGSNCSLNKVMEKIKDSEQFSKHGEGVGRY